MKVKLWGTRGSIASSGPETVRYGGDTSSVEVRANDGSLLILDAGSGIRKLGESVQGVEQVHILLSHLHMDHVQGLPFFGPLLNQEAEVHVWGPTSISRSLGARLSRYLSPPLFPVRVSDLPKVDFHDVPSTPFSIGSLKISADLITHPGSTLGYRIEENGASLAYLPDHEPALGWDPFPRNTRWTSGFSLGADVDLLIHDAQYTDDEYAKRIGWGHTGFSQLILFAACTNAKELVTFHHDPAHSDDALDELHKALQADSPRCLVTPGKVGLEREL